MGQRDSILGCLKHNFCPGSEDDAPASTPSRIGAITSSLLNSLHEYVQTPYIIRRPSAGEHKIFITGIMEVGLSEVAKDASESALSKGWSSKPVIPGDQRQTSDDPYSQTPPPTRELNRTETDAFTTAGTGPPPACSPMSQGGKAVSTTVPTMPLDVGAASVEVLVHDHHTLSSSLDTIPLIGDSDCHYWREISDEFVNFSRAPGRSDNLSKDPGLSDIPGQARDTMDKNRFYEECFRKILYGFALLSLASALPVVEAYPGEILIEDAQRGCTNMFWTVATPFLFAYGNRRTVSGASMATSCFVWMTTKADPAVPATAAWSIFAVWMFSATVFISDVAVGTDHGKLYMVLVLALTAYLMTLSPVVQMLKNEDAVTLVAACASLAAFLVSLAFKRQRNRQQLQGPEATV